MAGTAYHLTSGRMLHLEGCEHFYDDQPPREATDEELSSLPVCGTCAGRVGERLPSASHFACPSCFLPQPVSLRTPTGVCRDCANDKA